MTNIIAIEDIPHLHKPGQRLIGIDHGSRTIGVALSDSMLVIASPSHVIKRKKFTEDAGILMDFCNRQNVFAVILGLPLNMNGTEGPRAQAVRAFARNMMETICNLPFVLWDERLSTAAVERVMIKADMSRKKRTDKIDAVAAGFILQGALNRIQSF